MSRPTVDLWLSRFAAGGVPAEEYNQRPSMADPYLPFIIDTLTKYPRICASRVFEMVRERGYSGRPVATA